MGQGAEAALKIEIKEHLKSLGAYQFSPVQQGYGAQTLDLLCAIRPAEGGQARFVGIETKSPGKKPTPRQEQTAKAIEAAGGIAFWCDSFEAYLGAMVLHGFINQPPRPAVIVR